jgi:hypothetical protein
VVSNSPDGGEEVGAGVGFGAVGVGFGAAGVGCAAGVRRAGAGGMERGPAVGVGWTVVAGVSGDG